MLVMKVYAYTQDVDNDNGMWLLLLGAELTKSDC